MTARTRAWLLICALPAAGCGDDTTDIVTGPSVPFFTEFYSGVLDPGERRFYSFTLDTSGPVTVTLASVVNADSGAPLTLPLRVGVGRPQGTECVPAAMTTVPAALQSQLTHLAPEGIHCIDVTEPGSAVAPVRFAVRFTHP